MSHDPLHALQSVFNFVRLMTNLTLKLALVNVLNVLIVVKFDLLIIATCSELTSGIVELLTLESNLGFALFDMVFDLALIQIDLTDSALNHDLIIKLHQDSVWALDICARFAVGTLETSLSCALSLPLVDTVITEKFLTILALFRLSNHVHTNNAIEVLLNLVLRAQMGCSTEFPQEFLMGIVLLLLLFLSFPSVISR